LGDDDSEDEYVEGGGKGGGEASGSESGSVGAVEEEEDDEVDEESDIDDDGKGKKGKGKGKGKDKAIATPRGAQKRKRSALSATPATPATPRGRGAAASARKARASVPGRRSTAAALSNSTLNVFPPTYRDLLLDSALSLVRKSDADKPAFQPPRPPVFPPGPVTPFLSRLAADPETPDSEGVQRAEVVPDDPHGPDRRDHMRDLAKRVGIVPPWDGWEGEGWWPDMVRELRETEHEVEEKGKGKGKAKGKGAASEAPDGPVPGWKWRADVRLGLDDIGRCSPSDVLSKR
jgi:hypothetical protein